MPKVTYLLPDGSEQTHELREGQSVMEGAIRNGINNILAECGGAAMCATCHTIVEGGPISALPELGEDEDFMLEETASERTEQSRLSCQIKMTAELDGLVVRIPEAM